MLLCCLHYVCVLFVLPVLLFCVIRIVLRMICLVVERGFLLCVCADVSYVYMSYVFVSYVLVGSFVSSCVASDVSY